MSSPVQVPPPRFQRRSMAGPAVLIIIGVLFLLGNMGVLHWENLGIWFAHYWPALLILWGIIKLVEYQRAQKEGLRPQGIGAGGVFLIVVLIVFGLAATQATRFNWGALRDTMNIDNEDMPFFGHSYSFDEELQQDFPAGASLHIVDDRGNVTVNSAEDGNQIRVTVRKRVGAESESDAGKWNAGTKPTITVSGNNVTLNANTQGAGDHWVAADLDVTVPAKAAVTITGRRGDVTINGRQNDVDVSNQHGSVNVTDITGKVSLSLQHSSARVSNVSSDVSVEGRPDDVSLEDVKGQARLTGEFDSIKLAKMANPVTFKSARTDLEFARLNGDLDMDSGDLRATDVMGPFHLTTRSKDIHLEGVSGDVRLKNENGDVELRVSKLGNMQVDNRKNDIRLYLPDKAGFQIDANARNGEIQSDFPDIKVDSHNDQAAANGTVGNGGSHVVLNNEHGDIQILKGSSVAEVPPVPPAPKAPHIPAPKVKPAEPTDN